MRKLLPVVFLFLCSTSFAASKPPVNATQSDLKNFAKTMYEQVAKRHLMERREIQSALTMMQSDLQKQVRLLESQIKTLSQETAKGMDALRNQLNALDPKSQTKTHMDPATQSN